jgi:hypothetical protein
VLGEVTSHMLAEAELPILSILLMNYGMNGNFSSLIAELTEQKMRP